MKRLLGLIAITTFAHIASAQLISIGALGGVPITDTTGTNSESRPYIVGGSAEIRLPAGFALEADALYRRVGRTLTFGTTAGPNPVLVTDRQRGNSWEFPLIGKYYFRRSAAWQPFVGTGFAFRTINVNEAGTSFSPVTLLTTPSLVANAFRGSSTEPLDVGATVSAGLRFHYSRLSIAPQIRYTRWGGNNLLVRKNEATFLLGVSF